MERIAEFGAAPVYVTPAPAGYYKTKTARLLDDLKPMIEQPVPLVTRVLLNSELRQLDNVLDWIDSGDYKSLASGYPGITLGQAKAIVAAADGKAEQEILDAFAETDKNSIPAAHTALIENATEGVELFGEFIKDQVARLEEQEPRPRRPVDRDMEAGERDAVAVMGAENVAALKSRARSAKPSPLLMYLSATGVRRVRDFRRRLISTRLEHHDDHDAHMKRTHATFISLVQILTNEENLADKFQGGGGGGAATQRTDKKKKEEEEEKDDDDDDESSLDVDSLGETAEQSLKFILEDLGSSRTPLRILNVYTDSAIKHLLARIEKGAPVHVAVVEAIKTIHEASRNIRGLSDALKEENTTEGFRDALDRLTGKIKEIWKWVLDVPGSLLIGVMLALAPGAPLYLCWEQVASSIIWAWDLFPYSDQVSRTHPELDELWTILGARDQHVAITTAFIQSFMYALALRQCIKIFFKVVARRGDNEARSKLKRRLWLRWAVNIVFAMFTAYSLQVSLRNSTDAYHERNRINDEFETRDIFRKSTPAKRANSLYNSDILGMLGKMAGNTTPQDMVNALTQSSWHYPTPVLETKIMRLENLFDAPRGAIFGKWKTFAPSDVEVTEEQFFSALHETTLHPVWRIVRGSLDSLICALGAVTGYWAWMRSKANDGIRIEDCDYDIDGRAILAAAAPSWREVSSPSPTLEFIRNIERTGYVGAKNTDDVRDGLGLWEWTGALFWSILEQTLAVYVAGCVYATHGAGLMVDFPLESFPGLLKMIGSVTKEAGLFTGAGGVVTYLAQKYFNGKQMAPPEKEVPRTPPSYQQLSRDNDNDLDRRGRINAHSQQ